MSHVLSSGALPNHLKGSSPPPPGHCVTQLTSLETLRLEAVLLRCRLPHGKASLLPEQAGPGAHTLTSWPGKVPGTWHVVWVQNLLAKQANASVGHSVCPPASNQSILEHCDPSTQHSAGRWTRGHSLPHKGTSSQSNGSRSTALEKGRRRARHTGWHGTAGRSLRTGYRQPRGAGTVATSSRARGILGPSGSPAPRAGDFAAGLVPRAPAPTCEVQIEASAASRHIHPGAQGAAWRRFP